VDVVYVYQYLSANIKVHKAWKTLIKELAKKVRNAQSALASLQHDLSPEMTATESQCFYDCIRLIDSVLPQLPEDGFV
jgi:hypothetical protein